MDELIDRMRQDWDARAAEDAKYYTACQRRNQNDDEYEHGAPYIVARIRRDYPYLENANLREWRFLEIGCGIGRLMGPLSADCREIHGIDVSPEMAAIGRSRLSHIRNAHFHVTGKNDLAPFAGESFELVYSYAVFQHIPDRTLVYRYIDESFRVLKPGGIFIAQFNGAPPVEQRCDTWAGVWIPEEELLRYAKENGWQVLSSEGANTQYLWLTMRKPCARPGASAEPLAVTLTAALQSSGAQELFAGGPQGFATVYVMNLPDDYCDLNELSAHLGEHPAPIQYIGPVQPGNWRQINIYVPETTPLGSGCLALYWRGRRISTGFDVVVQPRPAVPPRLISITDGQELFLEAVIQCGVMQINLDGCRDIRSCEVNIAGRAVDKLETFCIDPLSRRYQVNVPVPEGIKGRQIVRVSVDGEKLPPYEVDVVERNR